MGDKVQITIVTKEHAASVSVMEQGEDRNDKGNLICRSYSNQEVFVPPGRTHVVFCDQKNSVHVSVLSTECEGLQSYGSGYTASVTEQED